MGFLKTSTVVKTMTHSPPPKHRRQPSLASSSTSSSTSSSCSSSFEHHVFTVEDGTDMGSLSRCQELDLGSELQQSSWNDDDTDSPFVSKREKAELMVTECGDEQQLQQLQQLTMSPAKQLVDYRIRVRSRPESSFLSSQSSWMIQNSRSPSNVFFSSHISSSSREDAEYQIKNTIDALVGSISAAINFCRHSGVPKPSILQLERNLKMKRYFAVLSRIQHYIGCVRSETMDDLQAKIYLAVTAWEALCRYKALEYKLAYKSVSRLRNAAAATVEQSGSSFSLSSSSAVLSRTSGGKIDESEIERAIQLQIKYGEQATMCQKKLYLVQRWQRQVLSRGS